MNENANGNEYWLVTREGSFYIVAKELETTYDEKQQCDYVVVIDEGDQSIGYFKDVIYWIKANCCLQANLNDMKGEENVKND